MANRSATRFRWGERPGARDWPWTGATVSRAARSFGETRRPWRRCWKGWDRNVTITFLYRSKIPHAYPFYGVKGKCSRKVFTLAIFLVFTLPGTFPLMLHKYRRVIWVLNVYTYKPKLKNESAFYFILHSMDQTNTKRIATLTYLMYLYNWISKEEDVNCLTGYICGKKTGVNRRICMSVSAKKKGPKVLINRAVSASLKWSEVADKQSGWWR